jgi:antitoxin (DNA-binding transcriptional repressor) of toxin-antitoxin stability system
MFDTEDTRLNLTATEFKAKCLELFRRLDIGTLTEVTITRRGKPIATVRAADVPDIKGSAWGFMRGTIKIAPGVDLTAPVIDEEPDDPFIGKGKSDDAAA